jgi:hypothetical protein
MNSLDVYPSIALNLRYCYLAHMRSTRMLRSTTIFSIEEYHNSQLGLGFQATCIENIFG